MIDHGERAKIHFRKNQRGGAFAFLGVAHVDTVGSQGQFQERTGKAGIGFDDGENRARGDIDAGKGTVAPGR